MDAGTFRRTAMKAMTEMTTSRPTKSWMVDNIRADYLSSASAMTRTDPPESAAGRRHPGRSTSPTRLGQNYAAGANLRVEVILSSGGIPRAHLGNLCGSLLDFSLRGIRVLDRRWFGRLRVWGRFGVHPGRLAEAVPESRSPRAGARVRGATAPWPRGARHDSL